MPQKTPSDDSTTEPSSEKARNLRRRALIRFHIWKDGPISRSQLAEKLGLNIPTISAFVGELLDSGDVIECGLASSTGGRKAQLLEVRADAGSVIGLTFSSRGISSAISDLHGKLANSQIYPFSVSVGKDKALATLKQAVSYQLDFAKANPVFGPVRQIGLGISGLLNTNTGVSRAFPRFEEWADVPVRDLLSEKFGIPAVVDNHIAAIALAESVSGQLRGYRNALFVQLGPGLGVGIVVGGRIYRGSRLNVGEFGHTTVGEDGPICYCGNYGCLESIASDYALTQQAEAALREGVKTRIPEFTSVPGGRITPGSIFRAAAAGDRFAINLIEKVARHLGTGIANLVNIFGPEQIVLGGTMAEAGDVLLNPLFNTLASRTLDPVEKGSEVRVSSFGKEEAMKGAVTLALYEFFSIELGGVFGDSERTPKV
ncbi:MAG: ROK family transcriptional regulator [Candidatus Sumerlaeaceae bacterium]|nr:ROK family transcriptional regulator [Candidatus Sumerlaeaceae bacterium]